MAPVCHGDRNHVAMKCAAMKCEEPRHRRVAKPITGVVLDCQILAARLKQRT